MITENYADDVALHAQKKALCSLIVWGITYSILILFFVVVVVSVSIAAGISGFIDVYKQDLWRIIIISPALATPFTVVLMYFGYSRGYYKAVRFCRWIPILLFNSIPFVLWMFGVK